MFWRKTYIRKQYGQYNLSKYYDGETKKNDSIMK